MTIGSKLQARRKELHLTQEAVAHCLHVSRQAISNWETGKNYPDLDTIIAISDVYQISLDTLLKGDTSVVKEIKKNLHSTILKRGLLFLSVLSLIICFIVDLAITQRLTWSLIPLLSLAALGLLWLTYEKARSHKLVKSAVCLSLLSLPYLWLLDKSLLSASYTQSSFFPWAVPISLLSLAIFWVVAVIQLTVNWHWCYSLALLCLLAIGGNYVMSLILGISNDRLSILITTFANGGAAILFFLLGLFLTNSHRLK